MWNDLNKNAAINAGENGLAGVTLALVDSTGKVIATTTTAADGTYSFFDVPAGSYTVKVTDQGGVLNGYQLTSGLDQYPVSVVGTTSVTNVNFGYVREGATGSIGDRVWLDANGDGVQNAGEAGISRVTLRLVYAGADGVFGTGDDNNATTTTTDAAGFYEFQGLVAGGYKVRVTDTSGVLTGLALTGGTNPTGVINLGEGQIYENADFGYGSATGKITLGDTVFSDANNNGIQDPGEVGIGGVTVTLKNGGTTIATTTTAADGTYRFTGYDPGTYTVTVTPPTGYNPTPTTGSVNQTVSIPANTANLTLDFGFKDDTTASVGTIGDKVFLDSNASDTFNAGEGIGGVTLNLLNNSGVVVGTTTTDDNGTYHFYGVPFGTYTVQVSDLNGAVSGLTLTSGANPTGSITLNSGSPVYNDADFGYRAANMGAIGNLVWHDLNGNGFRDAGEPGIQGVTVQLWLNLDNNDTAIHAGIDNLVRTTTTNANGEYVFSGLPPAKYQVQVVATSVLSGFNKTTGTSPGSDNYSQANPYAVTLTASGAGVTNYTADFGYKAGTGYLASGKVFIDTNGSGAWNSGEAGVQQAAVLLYRDLNGDGKLDASDPQIGYTLSASDGTYSFTDLPNGKYLIAVQTAGTTAAGLTQTTQSSATGWMQPVTINNAQLDRQ